MKKWEINYCGHTIVVENKSVGGELQDEQIGFAGRPRLWGQLKTGETIKGSLESIFFYPQYCLT